MNQDIQDRGPDSGTPGTVTLTTMGDLCPVDPVDGLLLDGELDRVFNGFLDEIRSSDITIANLECPLTASTDGSRKTGPSFSASPGVASALSDAGFNCLSLANNHILDRGVRGLEDTVSACSESCISVVGAGRTLAASLEPLILLSGGISIAVHAFAEHEFTIASVISAGTAPLDPVLMTAPIQESRKNFDIVIVLIHGGNEYYPLPSPRLRSTCRWIAGLGADAVICSHSHVASGFEKYGETLIYYGLGNFLFPSRGIRPSGWHHGYAVRLVLNREGIVDSSIKPYSQCLDSTGVTLLREEERDRFLGEIHALSDVVRSDTELGKRWESFCTENEIRYLGYVSSLGPLGRRVLKYAPALLRRISPGRLRLLLNLIRCESHRDAIIDILEKRTRD